MVGIKCRKCGNSDLVFFDYSELSKIKFHVCGDRVPIERQFGEWDTIYTEECEYCTKKRKENESGNEYKLRINFYNVLQKLKCFGHNKFAELINRAWRLEYTSTKNEFEYRKVLFDVASSKLKSLESCYNCTYCDERHIHENTYEKYCEKKIKNIEDDSTACGRFILNYDRKSDTHSKNILIFGNPQELVDLFDVILTIEGNVIFNINTSIGSYRKCLDNKNRIINEIIENDIQKKIEMADIIFYVNQNEVADEITIRTLLLANLLCWGSERKIWIFKELQDGTNKEIISHTRCKKYTKWKRVDWQKKLIERIVESNE